MAGVKIHHMGMTCKDQAATERFYTKYFGFERARVVQLGETQIVFIKLGDVYLELFQAESAQSLPAYENDGPQYPTWRHLAFDVDDVDAKLAELGDDAVVSLGPLDFDDFIPGCNGQREFRTFRCPSPDLDFTGREPEHQRSHSRPGRQSRRFGFQ